MTIGGSIFLLVVGAVMAFAVQFDLAGLDLQVVGFILMAGGLAGIGLGLTLRNRRVASRVTTTQQVADQPVTLDDPGTY